MAEVLVNGYASTTTTALAAAAGPGATVGLADALPASAVGKNVRVRLGGGEFVLCTATTATLLTVVQRACEDAARFPAQAYGAGTDVRLPLTRDGLPAVLAPTFARTDLANTFAPDQVFVTIIAAEVRDPTDSSWIDFAAGGLTLVAVAGTITLSASGGVTTGALTASGVAVGENLSVGGAVITPAVWDPATNPVLDLGTAGLLAAVVPLRLPHLADASAPNDSTYYSTTAGKLAYKDSGGVVHALY